MTIQQRISADVPDFSPPVAWHPGSITMIFLASQPRSFRCDCGCNVFHRGETRGKYICNSCNESFTGDK